MEAPTRRQAVYRAVGRLQQAGVDTPELDADVLLRHVLGESGEVFWRALLEPLSPEARDAYLKLVARREAREPVAYITGHKAFFGLELQVDRRVLIPRPETERLIEAALAWAGRHDPATAADIGCGSGAIALALATRLPALRVYAVDSSPDALAVARLNARRLGLEARLTFLQGRLTEPMPEAVDLLTANLPYVSADAFQGLAPEIRRHEPQTALVAGPGGTEVIEAFLAEAPAKLKAGGAAFVEIGSDQASALTTAARRAFPAGRIEVLPDLAGHPRVLCIVHRTG